ncbi:NADH-ubiquinone oxidoreductase 39 kDa subunit [Candidatus Terasakiella magnetica]|uniref:NADH-ubiquinone oxidoreductase 39 kDa subunit n=1 Tax=Candidatus Terasakiella magnetica TaxID=1867952 RepID=A0A1C3RDZ2_9PROT|nr:complex I NDUFA9 subunit family protein [Candidatus Terasakiella magnetica]SCA55451.1 NADH-ubiquinone oxidoreductase 39 kDa subunit [Candidatus Terasakiella magnetica]
MGRRIATVFGGSGFLGRHIVKRLAEQGYTVRAAVRDVEAGMCLKPFGNPGQIILQACNVRNADMVARSVEGADVVFNLVGLLSQFGKQTFDAVHAEGAHNIAKACAEAGADNLIHVSALGANEESESQYARTKGAGEKAVLNVYPTATILRPSVVFGPEDNFFNKFAGIMRFTPALPVIGAPLIPDVKFDGDLDINLYGDGGAKLQPVYVGDVAQAAVNAIDNADAKGKTYELGGPEVMTFMGIMKRLLKHTQRNRILAPVAYPIAKILGGILGFLPKPLLTGDQVVMLETDNVVSEGALTLQDLGVEATLADVILPTYLCRFKELKNQSRHIERRI